MTCKKMPPRASMARRVAFASRHISSHVASSSRSAAGPTSRRAARLLHRAQRMAQRGGRLRISTKTLSRPTPTPEGREAVHPPTDTLRRPEEPLRWMKNARRPSVGPKHSTQTRPWALIWRGRTLIWRSLGSQFSRF